MRSKKNIEESTEVSPLYFLEFFPCEVSGSTIRKVKVSSNSRHTTSLKEFRKIARDIVLEDVRGI